MKKQKQFLSDCGHNYELSFERQNYIKKIIIYPLLNEHEQFGYEFSIINNKINWEEFPEHTALLPDDVKLYANKFIKNL